MGAARCANTADDVSNRPARTESERVIVPIQSLSHCAPRALRRTAVVMFLIPSSILAKWSMNKRHDRRRICKKVASPWRAHSPGQGFTRVQKCRKKHSMRRKLDRAMGCERHGLSDRKAASALSPRNDPRVSSPLVRRGARAHRAWSGALPRTPSAAARRLARRIVRRAP